MTNISYSFSATPSPKDLRTFTYAPTKANVYGGEKWEPEFIEHQHKVGICTAISTTMRARKHFNIKFSAEFQYLCQKKFYDLNWDEGSSIFHAIKVGKNIGFLPESEWTFTTEQDRYLPYNEYIEKLKAIPDTEIERLKTIANKYKIKAYANVPVDRDFIANAIDESGSLLSRFVVGSEWWMPPIEPLRNPLTALGGHAVNNTKYSGGSFRIANSWGTDWADKGTAYYLLNSYTPTENWKVWFENVPQEIQNQVESRATIIGKIMDLLQQIIVLVAKLA